MVAAGFDLVAVGIEGEGTVVVLVIVRPRAGPAVVLAAGLQGRGVEGVDVRMPLRLEADMREALPRDVRTGGGSEPAWLGDVDGSGNAQLRFSRAGPEFAPEPGSAGQRIGYRLRDGAIEVQYWPRLDQPATVSPQPYALAGGIAAFRVDYLDSTGAWRERWPALGESPVPRAVRVGITLANGDRIERWLVLR